MSDVEQRVVQMTFDNAQFEAGVQQTLQSLNKLDQSINENTASNKAVSGLGSLFDTLKDKLTGTEDSVKTLANAFSPLGIAGKAAIENITNKLTDFTLNAAKTLSGITSMQSGFEKFTLKSKAVSDLMNATGASMNEVADALDNLNWFTDETSYNFTDMVSTMSKLAATGEKDLSKLTRSAEGIALWGAKAGANAQTVSRAMNQLTQAVGRGYITYQDWLQSAINTNMATAEIKQQLIDAAGATAIAAGATTDFNDSLQKGWLTFDVFNKVMDQYTEGIDSANYANGEFINSQNGAEGATNAFSEAAFRNAQECKTWGDVVDAVADSVGTSWMETFEYIFGDFETAKALWTGLANLAFEISGKFGDARNAIFEGWSEAGGRTAMLQSFVNVVNALYRAVNPVIQAFKQVFGVFDGSGLAKGTKAVEAFTKTLLLSRNAAVEIYKVFYVLFAVIQKVGNAIKPYVKYIALAAVLVGTLKTIRGLFLGGLGLGTVFGILKLIVGLGLVSYLTKSTNAAKGFSTVLGAISKVLGVVASAVVSLIKKVSGSKVFSSALTLGKSLLSLIATLVSKAISGIAQIESKLKAAGLFTAIKNGLAKIPSLLSSAFTTVSTFFTEVTEGLKNKSGNIFQIIATAANDAFKPVDLLSKAFEVMGNVLTGLKTAVIGIFNMLTGNSVLGDQATETEKVKTNVEKLGGIVEDTGAKVETTSKTLETATKQVSGFASILQTVSSAASGAFSKLSAGVQAVKDGFKSITGQEISLKKLVPVAVLLAYGAVMLRFAKTAKTVGDSLQKVGDGIDALFGGIRGSIANFFNAMASVPKSISSFLTSVTNAIKAQSNVALFKGIAFGIAAITASLIALSMVPFERLENGAVIMAGIVLAVVVVMELVSKFQATVNPANVWALTGAIVGFTVCVLALNVALGITALVTNHIIDTSETVLESIGRIAAPIIALGALMGLIVIFANVMASALPMFSIAGTGLLQLAAGVAAFSAAMILANVGILATVLVIAQLSAQFVGLVAMIKMVIEKVTVTPELLLSIIGAFAVVTVGILAFVAVFKLLSKSTLNVAKNALILAGSITLLAVAFGILSVAGAAALPAVVGISSAVIILTAFMGVLGKFKALRKGVATLNSLTKGMLMFAASIVILSVAVKIISGLGFVEMITGLIGVAGLMIGLASAVKIMNKAELGKTAAGLLALVAAMYALLPLLALFSIDWTMFLPGLIEVCGMLLALGKSVQWMSGAKGGDMIATLLSLSATIVALTAALLVLSDIPVDQLLGASVALGTLMLTMGVVSAVVGKMTETAFNFKSWLAFAGVMAVMTAAVVVLSFAMQNLIDVPWQSLAGFAAVVVAFGIAIGVMASMLQAALTAMNPGTFVEMIVIIGVFTAAVYALSLAMQNLANVPVENIQAFAAVVGVFGVALALVTTVIGVFSAALTAAVPFLLSFTAVLGALALAFISFGVACVGFGVGATLFATALNTITAILPTFTANFTMFITSLASLAQYAGSLITIGAALAVVGVLLVPFGVGAIVAAAAVALFGGALLILNAALPTTVQNITALMMQFTMLAQNNDALSTFAKTLSAIGKSLIVFAAGAVLAGAAAKVLSSGIIAISGAVSVGVSALNKLKTTISGTSKTMQTTSSNSGTWGAHMATNYAKGIQSGQGIVSAAISGIAKTVWEWIHSSAGAEKGYLVSGNVLTWGLHHAINFATGITKGNGSIATAVSGIGEKIASFKGMFKGIGESLGSVFNGGLFGKISEGFNKIKGMFSGETSISETLGNMFGIEVPDSIEEWTENIINLDDLMPDLNEQINELTDSTLANVGATSDAAGATSDAAGATSDAASKAKELAEEQERVRKYTDYATKSMTQFMNIMGQAMSFDTDSLILNAKEQFGELAEQLYQDTLKESDTIEDVTQTAEERAKAVQNAFIEAFENVRDAAKDALVFDSSFSKNLSDSISVKEMIANFKSQSSGITSFYERLGTLAGKGFNYGIIKDLMEEGTSAYPKVSSMLKATTEQIQEMNAAWDSKETIANQSAALAMTSLMTAMTIQKLKSMDVKYKELNTTTNDALKNYKAKIQEAQESGADMEEVLNKVAAAAGDTSIAIAESGPERELFDAYQELQKTMKELEYTNEDLQEAMMNDNGFEYTENTVLTIMQRISDLQSIIAQFDDIGTTIFDNVKSQLSSSISYFDEWSAKYEMTGDTLMKNVQSQIEGVAKYNANIQTIIKNGGQDIVSLFGDKITPDIANAMAQLGTDALNTLKERLVLLQEAPVAGATAAQASWLKYGQIGGMGYQEAITQLAQNQELLNQTQTIGTNVGQGLANGMQESTTTVNTEAQNLGQAAVDGVATGAGTHSPSTKTHQIGQYLDQGLMNGIRSMSETTSTTARLVAERVVSTVRQVITTHKFSEIGKNICRGMIEGINSESGSVANAARAMAESAYAAALSALSIHSPSRKMAWAGRMFDAGFAEGVDDGSASMQNSIVSTMQDALQTAVDLMDSTGDMQPTIRPVIDLSDAQNGSRLLSSMFNDIGPMRVGANIGQIVTPTDRMSAAIQGMNGSTVTNGDTNLYIYGAQGQDVNKLADVVIKRLNNEYARRKAAWS